MCLRKIFGNPERNPWIQPGWDPRYTFYETFKVRFVCLNGYDTFWDSADDCHDAFDLLQEAIRENGGVEETLWVDGMEYTAWVWKPKPVKVQNGSVYMADLLLFFTNQDTNIKGLSPPDWHAAIIRLSACVTPGSISGATIQHELSHQFRATHCGNICVMNPNWAYIGVIVWCGGCQQTIKKWFSSRLGDVNFDGKVDSIDIGIVCNKLGLYDPYCDLNSDHKVNWKDFSLEFSYYIEWQTRYFKYAPPIETATASFGQAVSTLCRKYP